MRRTLMGVMAIASLLLMLNLISAEEKQPDVGHGIDPGWRRLWLGNRCVDLPWERISLPHQGDIRW
jgi:hypothetical protein